MLVIVRSTYCCCIQRSEFSAMDSLSNLADWKVRSSDLSIKLCCGLPVLLLADPCRSSELTDLQTTLLPIAWRSVAMPRWSSANVALDMRCPRIHQWPWKPFGDARKVVLDKRHLGRVLHKTKTLLGQCPETAVPRLGVLCFGRFWFVERFVRKGCHDHEAKIWCEQKPGDLLNAQYSSSKIHGPLTPGIFFVCGCFLLSK